MNKILFQEELKHIESQIKIVEELDNVNQYLQRNNWVFIHPYSQVGDIGILNKLIVNTEKANELVVHFFERFLRISKNDQNPFSSIFFSSKSPDPITAYWSIFCQHIKLRKTPNCRICIILK